MAVTIKKTKNQHSYTFMTELIEQTIRDKIFNTLGLKRRAQIKMVDYFLTFSLCEVSNEKIISSIFVRLGQGSGFKSIDVREVEISGVTVVEFLDYLDENGANIIDDATKYINYM